MTKKLLAPINLEEPAKVKKGFAVPIEIDGTIKLVTAEKMQLCSHGVVVYVGRDVTPYDLFARMVDGGHKVNSVENQLQLLRRYIDELGKLSVGNVVRLAGDGSRLCKVADRFRSSSPSQLP